MSKHIHAEHMLQYAQDAMETDKPWERWQVRQWYKETIAVVVYGDWRDCAPGDMTFPIDFEYRRKPRTIDINGYEVPEPVRKPLVCGTDYFIPTIGGLNFASGFYWYDDKIDRRFLEHGLVHLTEEAAIAHAKALLSFTAKLGVSDE